MAMGAGMVVPAVGIVQVYVVVAFSLVPVACMGRLR